MKSIGEQLRSAREAQNRSLDDIAQATRINKKFLEELEQDIIPKVPATYVNAFIKSFAQEVGLDPVTVLESVKTPPPISGQESAASGQAHSFSDSPSSNNGGSNASSTELRPKGQMKMLITLLMLIGAGFTASVFLLRDDRSLQTNQEASFSEVVKERETKANPPITNSDSIVPKVQQPKSLAIADSLFLEGVASESVWVRVVIDGVKTSEFTFPPLFRMKWKAKKGFLVSLGNASGVAFTLNGKILGVLNKDRKPVKNFSLSHETLQKFRSEEPKKEHDGKR